MGVQHDRRLRTQPVDRRVDADAVGGATPLIGVPSTPTTARLDAVISEKCSPNGLIRNRSSWPGTSIEKWFEMPSWKSNFTAMRNAAASSMRASRSSVGGFIAVASLSVP
jgi:hypothetical protein